MKVALSVTDFLRRAEDLYPDRVGIVDEPDQPAETWGELTYAEVATRARALAAGLEALGIGEGDRVVVDGLFSVRPGIPVKARPVDLSGMAPGAAVPGAPAPGAPAPGAEMPADEE